MDLQVQPIAVQSPQASWSQGNNASSSRAPQGDLEMKDEKDQAGVNVSVADVTTQPLKNRKAYRKPQRGYLNLFRAGVVFRFKSPMAFIMPSVLYPKRIYTQRDAMGRLYKNQEDDRYISEKDQKMKRLVVQTVDEILDSKPDQLQTWRRTFIRNKGPWILRLAYWPAEIFATDIRHWSSLDWLLLFPKWIAACAALFPALLFFDSTNRAFQEGMYNPFPYRLREYPKVSRNVKEDKDPNQAISDATNPDITNERLLRPHTLCYLKSPESQDCHGIYPLHSEDEWDRVRRLRDRNLPYLFVSFTSEHFDINSQPDIDDLHKISEIATRRAGLPAYWLSYSCMSQDEARLGQDIHQINDVIRGASSVITILGYLGPDGDEDALFRTWGQRVWTLPEALLCTRCQEIEVYIRGANPYDPRILSKTEVARTAWQDGEVSRQLVNHYDGSLTLSRLELVVLALKCLRKRNPGRSPGKGDLAYALMGLLRRRPRVDCSDSEFQALARLSLANDSDRLLERMICSLPERGSDWFTANDAWGANLWDIYPACQVSAIGNDDTVVLDGCYAAAIRWKSFAYVKCLTKTSWKRFFARGILRISPWISLILWIFAKSIVPLAGPAIIIIIVLLLFLMIGAPYLIKVLYGGKIWSQQPWLFGFEGYMDIDTIEKQIFGYPMGRLSWSVAGSPLSRHRPDKYGECAGVDPTIYDDGVKTIVDEAAKRGIGEPRVFTIVDTYTMTVTLFEAVRPPVMVLLCGSEGGMQRAVMCSYDWKSQTLSRESVLRMETPVLEKMWRIGRVKFGFSRSAGTIIGDV